MKYLSGYRAYNLNYGKIFFGCKADTKQDFWVEAA